MTIRFKPFNYLQITQYYANGVNHLQCYLGQRELYFNAITIHKSRHEKCFRRINIDYSQLKCSLGQQAYICDFEVGNQKTTDT